MNETTTTIVITSICAVVGVSMFYFIFRHVRRTPLTVVMHFMTDQNPGIFHILGYQSVIPDDGDSFEIYKHYLFDTRTLKFEQVSKQVGTGLDLESGFVARSLAKGSETRKLKLQLKDEAGKDVLHPIHPRGSDDPKFERFVASHLTSDTQKAPKYPHDCLIFTHHFDHGTGKMTLELRRKNETRATHSLKGSADHYFKGFVDTQQKRIYFIYQKEKYQRYGAALCILHYQTGELLLDEFIREN